MAVTAALPSRLARTGRDRVLVTPEGVSLPFTVASRGARLGALLLDFIFLAIGFIVVTIALVALAGGVAGLFGSAGSRADSGAALQGLIVLWIVFTFLLRYAWFLWFELGARGATPGKRLTGIRIAARDGGRLTAEMVIARNLLRDIELFLPVAFVTSAGADSSPAWLAATAWFLLFMLFPCFNRDRLRAGDVIAGTWVVEAPRRKLEATMALPAAEAPRYRFTEKELAVYGEYELQTLEQILREDRESAIESVHATIAAKIGRLGTDGEDGTAEPRAFLEAYYTQLRARLEAGMRMGRRKADKFADGSS